MGLRGVKIIFTVSVVLLSIVVGGMAHVYADDTATPSATSSQTQDLRNRINELQGKINDLKGEEKSLSGEIKGMDSKIALTQLRVNATQQEVNDLVLDIDTAQKKIINLESSLAGLTKVLLNRIIATYEAGAASQPMAVLAASTSVSDYVQKANYLRIAQEHDKRIIYDTVQAKNDYANQKAIFEAKKKKMQALQVELQDYTKELASQQDQKKKLLADTQGNEANYQRLLAQAKAQLASFSSFTQNQGGASLLSNQTVCDSWGCYYNQRDSQWGGLSLNGTQYTIASDGCLLTSMAMVITHYGHKVTPVDINSNPDNFASYYPAYLLYKISAGGVSAERTSASIDSVLASSNPVIVGVRAYGGTHFVVLTGGADGSYIMNDPYLSSGHDISFNAHYSVGSIFEVDKVTIL